MSKIYIIDVARKNGMRGAIIADLAMGVELHATCIGPRDPKPTDKFVGVMGHHSDIETAKWPATTHTPVVHYSGGTIPPLNAEWHYRFPLTLDRGPLRTDAIAPLTSVLIWLRDGGNPPEFLLVLRHLLDPLLALGVLLEGYPAAVAAGSNPDEAWFKPAVEAARTAQLPGRYEVGSEGYWADLLNSASAQRRWHIVYNDPPVGVPWAYQIVVNAKARWGRGAADAIEVYQEACVAVKHAWGRFGLSRAGTTTGGHGLQPLAEVVEEAWDGFQLLALVHIDWGANPLMQERSQLNHTGIGNTLAPLFWPDRIEDTRKVLVGEAGPHEYADTRDRLARWPALRAAVLNNIAALERDYTPFASGLSILSPRMKPEHWQRLAAAHGAHVRRLFDVAAFVTSVQKAAEAFDQGLSAVSEGRMTVIDLARLHGELFDAYSARKLVPDLGM